MIAIKRDVNVAICGHAWHGKSTLLGKTIADLGMVKRRKLLQAQKAAREGRDPSLVFAGLVFRDKNPTHGDLQRGITVNPSFVRFDFPGLRVTVIDTPGQDRYTNNRFSAMFQADGALLVVDVKDGVMRVTRQILRILKGYEIPLFAVTISKMDRVGYKEEPFQRTRAQVQQALREHGLPDDPMFFPSSAYEPKRDLFDPGEGTAGFRRIDWWRGPCFKSFMAGLDLKKIRPQTPLRIVIHSSSVYDHVPGVGKTVTGVVESGSLERGQTLVFEPVSRERGEAVTARVRSTELTRGHSATPGIPLEKAGPRQLVGIALSNLSVKESLRDLFRSRGILAGTTDAPPSTGKTLLAELTVFSDQHELNVGDHRTLHCHADRVGIQIKAITALRAEHSDYWEEGEHLRVEAGQWGRVVIECARPVAIETAESLAPLSRLVLRDGDIPLAYGRCMEVGPGLVS